VNDPAELEKFAGDASSRAANVFTG